MNNELTKSKSPGRPSVTVQWPDSDFTIDDLEKCTSLSKVTLYQKVKNALNDNILEKSGTKHATQGRPPTVFRKKTSIDTTVATSNVSTTVVTS